MWRCRRALGAAVALTMATTPGMAQPDDAREGYYYPPIASSEVFDRTLTETPVADRAVRIAFVTQVTRQQFEAPWSPRYAIFAKGFEADQLIIVALDSEVFKTLHRARAVMAQLSAPARSTQFFVENDLADVATFYDMLKIMGFETLTLSDGATWSHRVEFR